MGIKEGPSSALAQFLTASAPVNNSVSPSLVNGVIGIIGVIGVSGVIGVIGVVGVIGIIGVIGVIGVIGQGLDKSSGYKRSIFLLPWHSSSLPLLSSHSALQLFSSPALQLSSFPPLQLSSSSALKLSSPKALQAFFSADHQVGILLLNLFSD